MKKEKDTTATILRIQRMSTEDGPGIRSTVFFKGCPL
ncbi:MAG: glycyl-radical enzyme activating protein, partial [Deltaproteobacteria bacterium]|nr:glycyl-radical enzyme activating protein [Deltaproteobacteria bacterium]